MANLIKWSSSRVESPHAGSPRMTVLKTYSPGRRWNGVKFASERGKKKPGWLRGVVEWFWFAWGSYILIKENRLGFRPFLCELVLVPIGHIVKLNCKKPYIPLPTRWSSMHVFLHSSKCSRARAGQTSARDGNGSGRVITRPPVKRLRVEICTRTHW
jgi:hypothetical protein